MLLFTPAKAVAACCVDVHQARVCGRPHLQYGLSGVAGAAYQEAPACFPCASFHGAEILGTTVGIAWLWMRQRPLQQQCKEVFCSDSVMGLRCRRKQLSGNEPESKAYGEGCS